MTMQRCKDRILPPENETRSRVRQARQYAKHEQSCFLPPAQVKKQCRSSLALPALPVISNEDHDSFPRRPLPNSQVVSFSPSIFGASALQGKAPQAPHPTTTSEFFQEHASAVPSRCQNTHLSSWHPVPRSVRRPAALSRHPWVQ